MPAEKIERTFDLQPSAGLSRWSRGVFRHAIVILLTTTMLNCNKRLEAQESEVGKPVEFLPRTYADPAVPLLQLPTQFRSRRTTANIATSGDDAMEILNIKGAGCVRHLWFVFGEKELGDLEIEITVDGVDEAQVRMPFRSFFGTLLGFEDYHINSAGFSNFPTSPSQMIR